MLTFQRWPPWIMRINKTDLAFFRPPFRERALLCDEVVAKNLIKISKRNLNEIGDL